MTIEVYYQGKVVKTKEFTVPPRKDDYILVAGRLYMVNAVCHNTDGNGASHYEIYLTAAPKPSADAW